MEAAEPLAAARDRVLVFGAAGAIGKSLLHAITAKHGSATVVAALRRTPLSGSLAADVIVEMGVDLRDGASVERVVGKHAARIRAVWNLAAPLSVETEADPDAAEDTVVGGMRRLIGAMDAAGLPAATRLLFSDSIGSYGADAPRERATAAWLVAHPAQDPGSEYGRQKRRCRALLRESRFDTRWAVIPGVLHDEPSWGDGTTEYALEAIKRCAERARYVCPVAPRTLLPMVHIADLVGGMLELQDAERASLSEPEAGYALAGFSFSPAELVACLRADADGAAAPAWEVAYEADSEGGGAAARFAELWPDTICGGAARRDLGWAPTHVPALAEAVRRLLAAHAARARA